MEEDRWDVWGKSIAQLLASVYEGNKYVFMTMEKFYVWALHNYIEAIFSNSGNEKNNMKRKWPEPSIFVAIDTFNERGGRVEVRKYKNQF